MESFWFQFWCYIVFFLVSGTACGHFRGFCPHDADICLGFMCFFIFSGVEGYDFFM